MSELHGSSDRTLVDVAPADATAFEQLVLRARAEPLYQSPSDVYALRASYRAFADSPLARKPPAHVMIDPVKLEGASGFWLRPPQAVAHCALLYLHGGGYVCGDARSALGIAASLCVELSCPVLAIDYRQAPEHRFPAALEDALAASRWLAMKTERPLLLAGDSAGGGLAISTALGLADRGSLQAVGVISMSGVLDLTLSSSSWITNGTKDLISPSAALFLYESYLRTASPRDPRASPVFADLRRLPPTLLVVGGAECLLGESERLARSARACGRDVQLEVYASMPHNFVKFASPTADMAFERMGRWARHRLAPLYR